ncbi:MAG: protein kinase [Deltaproteobacteria bacterium]|nr:protein kinase [Deltaproteobacteria bacterium]
MTSEAGQHSVPRHASSPDASAVEDPNVGRTFGHYEVVRAIGAGGMGTVYLAVQPRIGKRVAVKVLHPEYARDPAMVQRFFQEAKLVNEIRNEHIVDVLDFGEHEQAGSYLVMEFLEGESLGERLGQGPLDEAAARHLGRQVADTLSAVHGIQVVHRDLKPDNVFLVARDHEAHYVKLLDFGIAKLVAAASEGDPAQPRLTAQHGIVGTPEYMAPELLFGRVPGPACDLYALGCMLYEMVAGVPPIVGTTVAEILEGQVHRQPPPLRLRVPSVSEEYERIVMTCLAKAPEDRFRDAAEVALALGGQAAAPRPHPVEASASTVVPPPRGKERAQLTRGGWLLVGAGLGLATLGLTATALWLGRTQAPPPSPTQPAGSAARARPVGLAVPATPRPTESNVPAAAARPATPPKPAAATDRSEKVAAPPTRRAAPRAGVAEAAERPGAKAPRRRPGASSPAARTALSDEQVAALRSLQRLCDQGAVSPAECREKRTEIMRRGR